jgi:DNA-binding NarL/FixJ family response regulator
MLDHHSRNGAIGLLLADDSSVIRRAVKWFLDATPQVAVLGEATTFAETLTKTAQLKPDTVLMDLHMPDENTFDPCFIREQLLRAAKRVLIMSVWNDEESKALAVRYGSSVLLDKGNLASELVPTILATKNLLGGLANR